jgi:chromosomal replication initiation ATPase DnaA
MEFSRKVPAGGPVSRRRHSVIAGKDSTQDGVFSHLKHALRGEKADRSHERPGAKDMRGLEERLRSRVEWGSSPTPAPDYETRHGDHQKQVRPAGH